MMRGKRALPTIISAAALCVAIGVAPAAAQEQSSEMGQSGDGVVDITLDSRDFEFPVDFDTALVAADELSESVQAVRIENPEVVGEYSLSSSISPEQFVEDFVVKFGTEPQVVGLNVFAGEGTDPADLGEVIELPGDVQPFDAKPVPEALQQEAEQSLASEAITEPATLAPAALAAPQAVSTPTDWRPDQAEMNVFQSGSRAQFGMNYFWLGANDPKLLPTKWGLEFEVNLYTNTGLQGVRPLCQDYMGNPYYGVKDLFWAKNYSYNWAVYRPDFNVISNDVIGAYADYNDALDTCVRQSIGIGIRYPQKLLRVNGGIGLIIDVSAPRGATAASATQLGGTIQAVSDVSCNGPFPLSLTDCMGLNNGAGTWPISAPKFRNVLSQSTNYRPPACWYSLDKGLTPAWKSGNC